VMIVCFTALGFALLFGLGLLFPEYSVLDWSWALYLAGCIVIFLTLLRKYKSGTLPGSRPTIPDPSTSQGTPAGADSDLEELRKRVRQQKQSRGKEDAAGE
jgi:hypothetical protein